MKNHQRYWLQLIRGPRTVDDVIVYDQYHREIFTSSESLYLEPRLFTLSFNFVESSRFIVKKYIPIELTAAELKAIDDYEFASWTAIITEGPTTVHVLRLKNSRQWKSLPTLVLSGPTRSLAIEFPKPVSPILADPAVTEVLIDLTVADPTDDAGEVPLIGGQTPTTGNRRVVVPKRLSNATGDKSSKSVTSGLGRQTTPTPTPIITPNRANGTVANANRQSRKQANARQTDGGTSGQGDDAAIPTVEQPAPPAQRLSTDGPAKHHVRIPPTMLDQSLCLRIVLRRIDSNFNRGNVYMKRRVNIQHEYFVFKAGPPVGAENVALVFGRTRANFRRIPAASNEMFREAYKKLDKSPTMWIKISEAPNFFSLYRGLMPDALHDQLLIDVETAPPPRHSRRRTR